VAAPVALSGEGATPITAAIERLMLAREWYTEELARPAPPWEDLAYLLKVLERRERRYRELMKGER